MTVTDCVQMGIEAAAEKALEVAWEGAEAVWLSFDVDCLYAAFVPGTGWPEPGGFLPREVLKFIQIVARKPLAGIGIVECSPPLRQLRHHFPGGHQGGLRRARLPGQGACHPARAGVPEALQGSRRAPPAGGGGSLGRYCAVALAAGASSTVASIRS
jgi:hypothetical protein